MGKRPDTSRIIYRIESGSRFEWHVTSGPVVLGLARNTALQLKSNGIEVLVCTTEEFEKKGLPETYEADEYFVEGMGLPAHEAALDEPNSVSKLCAEGWEPRRRPPIETEKADSDNGPQTSRTKK